MTTEHLLASVDQQIATTMLDAECRAAFRAVRDALAWQGVDKA